MKKIWLILVVMISFPLTAFAVKMTNLYQAEVPIAAQTDDLKAQAVNEGFLQVLTKLSGDPEVTNNPVIKENLSRADYYVQEFSYAPSTTDSSQYLIRINYEPDDVKRLLKKAGIAYWGETRPLILVWLAVDSLKHPPEVIGNDMPGSIFASMKQQSNKYGVPLIFPMMDVTDMNQVSPTEVKAMALPPLKAAAKRYSPDAILIGWIQQMEDASFQSEWELILDKKEWRWASNSKSANSIISSIMNQVSQALSKQYIEKAAEVPAYWIQLEVINVTERNDLDHLLKYLKQLSPVRQVKLLEVSSDVVELSVLIQGSLASFQKHAAIGQKLSLKLQDHADNNKLVYVWSH